jgi:hypothetical protein
MASPNLLGAAPPLLRRSRPALVALLAMALSTLMSASAHAQFVAPVQTWGVWESPLGQTAEWTLVQDGLTEEDAKNKAAEKNRQSDFTKPGAKQYDAFPVDADAMAKQMQPGKVPNEMREYVKEAERVYERVKQGLKNLTGTTESVSEDTFNKVNAQIDEYNKMRDRIRDQVGYYLPTTPRLVPVRPGAPKTNDALPAVIPQSPAPAPQARPYLEQAPYNTPPEFKKQFPPTSQADTNPRLVMVDGPKTVTAPKGVAMRILIGQATLKRAETPKQLIADIRAGE